MSYIRNLTSKSRIFTQHRFTPSILHLNNNPDHKTHEKSNIFHQTRSYGVYGTNPNTRVLFRDPKWSQLTASGFLLARNMSTTIPDVLLAENFTETVLSQGVSVVSEVAVAAANSSFPVAALQYAIDGVHTFTGLNWWASIVITTLVIKTLLLPSMINELRSWAKFTILVTKKLEIKKKMQVKVNAEEVFEAMESSLAESGAIFSKSVNRLFMHGTIVVSYYLAIQNMVEKVPSFQTGGMSWFLDLTSADSFYILPCLNVYLFWIFSECYLPAGKMKDVIRFLVALSVPFVASFPQALFCHWITANLFSLVYKLTMKQQPVRKFFDIPIITPPLSPASESDPESQSKSNSSD